MARATGPLLVCGALLLTVACTRVVDGVAQPGFGATRKAVHGVDVDAILLVGDWTADATSLHLGPGGCGRDYRVMSLALLEVTFCGFPQSVSDTVMANIAANVHG